MNTVKSIRKNNRNQIRELMSAHGSLTKPELSQKTGLSVVTINSLISEMVKTGEILENGHVPSDGGRPSMQYTYNFDFRHLAIVYGFQKNSRNYFHFVAVNLKGQRISMREAEIDDVEVDSFSGILDEIFASDKKIAMLVFGLPGESNGEEILLNDYERIVGSTFIPYYRERYQVPVVSENDINAMIYGYCYFEHSTEPTVGIYFPRIHGPGAGAVLNGEIYRGMRNFAGEIGFAFPEIKWDSLDYRSKDSVLPIVGRILTVYCCVLAPAAFILYGDFFEEADIAWLDGYIRTETKGKFQAEIRISGQLEEEYERGLIAIGLDCLSRQA